MQAVTLGHHKATPQQASPKPGCTQPVPKSHSYQTCPDAHPISQTPQGGGPGVQGLWQDPRCMLWVTPRGSRAMLMCTGSVTRGWDHTRQTQRVNERSLCPGSAPGGRPHPGKPERKTWHRHPQGTVHATQRLQGSWPLVGRTVHPWGAQTHQLRHPGSTAGTLQSSGRWDATKTR